MGIAYPLPVLDPAATGPNILHGVNYASAGAGILNDTGSIFVSFISQFAALLLSSQVVVFVSYPILYITVDWGGRHVILLTTLYDVNVISLVRLSDDHILMFAALPGSP
jgi:hypothetical protein